MNCLVIKLTTERPWRRGSLMLTEDILFCIASKASNEDRPKYYPVRYYRPFRSVAASMVLLLVAALLLIQSVDPIINTTTQGVSE